MHANFYGQQTARMCPVNDANSEISELQQRAVALPAVSARSAE
jgi:hypothetical protein